MASNTIVAEFSLVRQQARVRRVLIISDPKDVHALAVARVIRRKGHECHLVCLSDFPSATSLTLRAGPSKREPTHHAPRHLGGGQFHTIWMRRRLDPWLPSTLHPADREAAARQCESTLRDWLASLDTQGRAFWVNAPHSDATANRKIFQLRAAEAAGLVVPETVLTNDPAEIKSFLKRAGGTAAQKLPEHASWYVGEGPGMRVFSAYTSYITCRHLPPDEVLRLCPVLLQPVIKKKFEVRVVCFGVSQFSVAIDSQSDIRARKDWRAGQWFVPMRPYALPRVVAAGVQRLLGRLGCVSASLDFIVTPDGEHIFLEANPQGQFLWMEQRTGVPVLDACAEFLLAADPGFHYRQRPGAARLPAYRRGCLNDLQRAARLHVVIEGAGYREDLHSFSAASPGAPEKDGLGQNLAKGEPV